MLDAQTDMPLAGATVLLDFYEPPLGTTSNHSGEFRFENVPYGRHSLKLSFVRYIPMVLSNLELSGGKEILLNIRLKEMVIETEEIVVKAYSKEDKPINEMSTVSARCFTIQETERYAGRLGDEFKLGRNVLALDLKTVYAGGKRFIPVDVEASLAEGNVVYDWQNAYNEPLKDYLRINVRITFKLNAKKMSQEWGFDLQNLSNHQNIYMQTWNNSTKQLETSYQSGFMPMITYRLRF